MRRALPLAVASLLAAAPVAHAENRFTLDAHPETPAHVLLQPSGTAIVAWTSAGAIPKVCVIPAGGTCTAPLTLPEPEGGADDVDGVFPVAGPGGTVTLIGPRHDKRDVLTWTPAGGAPAKFDGAAPDLTRPEDVIGMGANTLIGAVNNGLGIGSLGPVAGAFEFAAPGQDVVSSSLALDRSGRPVDAYYRLGESPTGADSVVQFYRYRGEGKLADPRSWSGPTSVATGDEPVLAGGPAGLFLLDVESAPGLTAPTQLELRKDDGTGFGAPLTLADDPGAELFDGGAATQSASGRLAVLWPQTRANDGLKVMRLFSSTDGGSTFTSSDVAALGGGYLSDRNASAAVGDDGRGVLTFVDEGGLEFADFVPLSASQQQPITTPLQVPFSGPTQPTKPIVVFDPAQGPFTTTSTRVPSAVVTLSTPRGCVRSGDVVMRLSIRARKLKGHVVVKVRKVLFRLDGRLMRTRTRAPFRARFHVDVAPGSRHELSAHVFIKTHGPRISRTLRNHFTACSA